MRCRQSRARRRPRECARSVSASSRAAVLPVDVRESLDVTYGAQEGCPTTAKAYSPFDKNSPTARERTSIISEAPDRRARRRTKHAEGYEQENVQYLHRNEPREYFVL